MAMEEIQNCAEEAERIPFFPLHTLSPFEKARKGFTARPPGVVNGFFVYPNSRHSFCFGSIECPTHRGLNAEEEQGDEPGHPQ